MTTATRTIDLGTVTATITVTCELIHGSYDADGWAIPGRVTLIDNTEISVTALGHIYTGSHIDGLGRTDHKAKTTQGLKIQTQTTRDAILKALAEARAEAETPDVAAYLTARRAYKAAGYEADASLAARRRLSANMDRADSDN